MDLKMDDLDGLEATRRLAGDPATASIPVIAVTASVLGDARQTALKAGCVDYLSKPIRAQQLFGMLRTHLHVRLVSGTARVATADQGLDGDRRGEVAIRLRNAAALGDVADIHRLADQLLRGTPAEAVVGERMKRLVSEFDFAGLNEMAASLAAERT
jgi:CheY-like chemotaxis protein